MTATRPAPTTATAPIEERGYARPDVLVSTTWLADNLDDPKLRLLESDEDVLLYDLGHIRGAQKIDWHDDLNDPVVRDYINDAGFERLLRRLGIDQTTTVVLYGDRNNWWATYAFWVFRLFGFPESQLRLLDGGRAAWEAEGRPLVTSLKSFTASRYRGPRRDDSGIRAFREEVLEHSARGRPLIDVRSPDEFTGRKLHLVEYPQEGVLRGGHVPGASNVPWARAASTNGTFKDAETLRDIYEGEAGLRKGDSVITYCRIGERSSHTWFVLTYLLGYSKVRNYDGSWTEWGNAVGLPIEK